jgi:hypothetical protein
MTPAKENNSTSMDTHDSDVEKIPGKKYSK